MESAYSVHRRLCWEGESWSGLTVHVRLVAPDAVLPRTMLSICCTHPRMPLNINVILNENPDHETALPLTREVLKSVWTLDFIKQGVMKIEVKRASRQVDIRWEDPRDRRCCPQDGTGILLFDSRQASYVKHRHSIFPSSGSLN